MCDYCGCRRVPEIAALCDEHEQIQMLADDAVRLASSGAPGLAQAVIRLKDSLTAHVLREEQGVFTRLKEAGIANAYYVDDLEEDHVRFASNLALPAEVSASELDQLTDELVRHIAIEEYDVFPAAANLLTDEPAKPSWPGN